MEPIDSSSNMKKPTLASSLKTIAIEHGISPNTAKMYSHRYKKSLLDSVGQDVDAGFGKVELCDPEPSGHKTINLAGKVDLAPLLSVAAMSLPCATELRERSARHEEARIELGKLQIALHLKKIKDANQAWAQKQLLHLIHQNSIKSSAGTGDAGRALRAAQRQKEQEKDKDKTVRRTSANHKEGKKPPIQRREQ
jgi:hypothetical protein